MEMAQTRQTRRARVVSEETTFLEDELSNLMEATFKMEQELLMLGIEPEDE